MGNKDYCVYMLISPEGKRYVGVTSLQPEKRWQNGNGYKSGRIHEALQHYSWNLWDKQIVVAGVEEGEAFELEKKYIELFDTLNPECGYNMSSGGKGGASGLKGEKSPNFGRHMSLEARRKISESGKGRKLSKEAIANISAAKRGDKNPMYGKHLSQIAIEKNRERMSKPVVQIKTGAIVSKFSSAVEASNRTGIEACNITRVCNGQRKTAGGYEWKFAKEEL